MKKANKAPVNAQLQKRAENNITIVNCAVVVYALVLIFLHSMSNSTATTEGAASIKHLLMYGGIISAMVVAAYAAYKSNKSLLKYSLMCLFVAVSSAAMLFCNSRGWADKVNFVALAMAIVFNLVYAYLTDKNLYYTEKKTRIIFRSVVGVFYAILMIVLLLAFFKVI